MTEEKDLKNKIRNQALDVYKISKVLYNYVECQKSNEELNDLIPIIKIMHNLSDELLYNISTVMNTNE